MIHNNQPVSKVAKKGRGQDAMPREPQQPNPSRIAETRAQDMYEKVYMVDCCVFASCPPPIRPLLRANFRPASLFFSQNFVPPKHILRVEFLNRPKDVSNLTCFDIGYVSMAGSNLRLFRRFSGTKVGRPAIFAFSHASPRWKTDGGKTACYFSRSSGSPKAGPTQLITGRQMCTP